MPPPQNPDRKNNRGYNLFTLPIFFCLCIFLLFSGCLNYIRPGGSPGRFEKPADPPNELARIDTTVAGAYIGQDFLMKTLVFNDSHLGPITDIRIGDLSAEPGTEIGLCGPASAYYLDNDFSIIKKIEFEKTAAMKSKSWYGADYQFIDIDNDNVMEYLSKGRSAVEPELLNHDGSVKWQGNLQNYHIEVGNVTGDSDIEFIVNAGQSGLVVLNKDGEEIKKIARKSPFSFRLFDLDKDGIDEIWDLEDYDGVFSIDADGNRLKSLSNLFGRGFSTKNFDNFIFEKFPGSDEHKLFAINSNTIYVFDLDGKQEKSLPANEIRSIAGQVEHGTIHFTNESEYLVMIITPLSSFKKSQLMIYDADGQIVFYEILPESCKSMAILKNDDKSESLLIGGNGKVWKYEVGSIIETEKSWKNYNTKYIDPFEEVGTDEVISFPDKAFEAAIRRNLPDPNVEITKSVLMNIKHLYADRNTYMPTMEPIRSLNSSREFRRSDSKVFTEDLYDESGEKKVKEQFEKITSIEGLQFCANLEEARLEDNDLIDLTPLSQLTKLNELNINKNNISDISPLVTCENLQILDMDRNKISDISSLIKIQNLKYISAKDNSISQPKDLGKLHNLKYLDLSGNGLSDVSQLSNLIFIEILYLANNNIDDISSLCNLKSLKKIVLTDNSVSDFSCLTSHANLIALWLNGNRISKLPDFSQMENLRILTLDDNQLSSLSGIATIPKIRALDLKGNNISDISELNDLTIDETGWIDFFERSYKSVTGSSRRSRGGLIRANLDLRNNRIKDISPILSLDGLDERFLLWLYGNPLGDKALNTDIPYLESLEVKVFLTEEME